MASAELLVEEAVSSSTQMEVTNPSVLFLRINCFLCIAYGILMSFRTGKISGLRKATVSFCRSFVPAVSSTNGNKSISKTMFQPCT